MAASGVDSSSGFCLPAGAVLQLKHEALRLRGSVHAAGCSGCICGTVVAIAVALFFKGMGRRRGWEERRRLRFLSLPPVNGAIVEPVCVL